jgi:hypothetical protein
MLPAFLKSVLWLQLAFILSGWGAGNDIDKGGMPGIPEGQPMEGLVLCNGRYYWADKYRNDFNGYILEYDPAKRSVRKVYAFMKDDNNKFSNGFQPCESLTVLNGKLYGVTYHAEQEVAGVLFEFDPAAGAMTKKCYITKQVGSIPQGGLTYYKGSFYGLLRQGGKNNAGVIYQWNPETNSCQQRWYFGGIDGYTPEGNLTLLNNKLYGHAKEGGANDAGVLFEYDPEKNLCVKKIDLGGQKGYTVEGNLAAWNNKLYGILHNGGKYNAGVAFEWNPISNAYNKKYEFKGGAEHYQPSSSMVMAGGSFFYPTYNGLTAWNLKNGTITEKVQYTDGKGKQVYGTFCPDKGKYYAVTKQGGDYNHGTIIEWNGSSTVVKLVDLSKNY